MPEIEKEYLVGTVRPTNRPELGQEIDLDERIPAKIKFVSLTMNFTQGTDQEFSTSMPGYEAKSAELGRWAPTWYARAARRHLCYLVTKVSGKY